MIHANFSLQERGLKLFELCGQTPRLPGRRRLPSEIRRRRPGRVAVHPTVSQTISAVSGKATRFSLEAIGRRVSTPTSTATTTTTAPRPFLNWQSEA